MVSSVQPSNFGFSLATFVSLFFFLNLVPSPTYFPFRRFLKTGDGDLFFLSTIGSCTTFFWNPPLFLVPFFVSRSSRCEVFQAVCARVTGFPFFPHNHPVSSPLGCTAGGL